MTKCLLVIDLQYDFMPGGSLAVRDADQIIPVCNLAMTRAPLVVMTQDWHPPHHGSFASQHRDPETGRPVSPGETIDLHGIEQVAWPDHCIAGTRGADFHADLDQSQVDHVVRKGTDPRIDSYSGFFDNDHRNATGLHEYLQTRQIEKLDVMGVATDFCVLFTVLDAIDLGYQVNLHRPGCRGVDLVDGDSERAIEKMVHAGATVSQ